MFGSLGSEEEDTNLWIYLIASQQQISRSHTSFNNFKHSLQQQLLSLYHILMFTRSCRLKMDPMNSLKWSFIRTTSISTV